MVFFEIVNVAMRSMRGEIALLPLCRYGPWSLPSPLPLWKSHSADAPGGERGEKEVKLQAGMASDLGEEDQFFQEIESNGLSFLGGCGVGESEHSRGLWLGSSGGVEWMWGGCNSSVGPESRHHRACSCFNRES